VGIPIAGWSWKVVAQELGDQFGIRLGRTSCRRYLHRPGFVWKRSRKHLVKADAAQRAAFVRTYADVCDDAAPRSSLSTKPTSGRTRSWPGCGC